jgi:hypothetical protein
LWSGRDPALYPLPTTPFDCPTGTCDNRACSDLPRNVLNTVDPFGRPHVERNACNRCPTAPPFEVLVVDSILPFGDTTILTDSEGNTWNMDSGATAPRFHGDPGLLRRDRDHATYRLAEPADGTSGGWQCRYWGGVLDDTSYDLGTYDYADAPGVMRAMGRAVAGSYVDNLHDDMDVVPHFANPRYVPNLTQKF